MTDRLKDRVRLLAETDGLIADIQSCLHELGAFEVERDALS
jgi:hypothetical protein